MLLRQTEQSIREPSVAQAFFVSLSVWRAKTVAAALRFACAVLAAAFAAATARNADRSIAAQSPQSSCPLSLLQKPRAALYRQHIQRLNECVCRLAHLL